MPPKRARENTMVQAAASRILNLLGTKPKRTKRATPAATPANARANAAAANLARANANVTRTSPAKQKTPGATKPKKTPAPKPATVYSSQSVNNFLLDKITKGSYREKVLWSLLIRSINKQPDSVTKPLLYGPATKPVVDRLTNMYQSISQNTPPVSSTDQIVFDFNDEQVFMWYFILWADGRHDKYLKKTVSFRSFLTNSTSYIREYHMITSSVEKTILAQLETLASLPELIKRAMAIGGVFKYDAGSKDIALIGTFEKNLKNNISKIFNLEQPFAIKKGQYPNIGKRIELCIDEEVGNLSKLVEGAEHQFSLALSLEQIVDPGSGMIRTGYMMMVETLLHNEKFKARLYATMVKMVYKHNGSDIYSTKLRAVTPQTQNMLNARLFEFYLETPGRQAMQIPASASAGRENAEPKLKWNNVTGLPITTNKNGNPIKKKEKIIPNIQKVGKALGDNEQIAPILFQHGKRNSQTQLFLGTGDGLCAFQFSFLFNIMYPGEQPPLMIDPHTSVHDPTIALAYGINKGRMQYVRTAHVKAQSPEIATRRSIFGRSKKTTNQANKFRVAATTFTPAQKAALANISNRSKQTYNRALAVKKIGRLAQNENFNRVKGLLNEWKVKKKLSENKQEYLTVMKTIKNKKRRTAMRNTYYKRNKYVSNSNSNSPS
jgi:hypothetical protein